MSIDPKPYARLVVLSRGVPLLAEPITCDDMRGPGSLFGEGFILPKPVGEWQQATLVPSGQPCGYEACTGSLLLYDEGQDIPVNRCLRVPQTTYLAGQVSSTFDVAWRLYEEGVLPEWGAVLAARQEHGRGQMRRCWYSPRGNLHVSLRLPSYALYSHTAAAIFFGLQVIRALEQMGCRLMLKWPNDLVTLQGRKVGGILLEEKNGVCIAGLGINLQEAPSMHELGDAEAIPAGVLLMASGSEEDDEATISPFHMWMRLAEHMLQDASIFASLSQDDGIAMSAQKLAWVNRSVRVTDAETVIEGVCCGLGAQAGLLVQIADGSVQECCSGSVRLLIP